MQKEITTTTQLLNKDGSLLAKGYCTTMNVVYNRECARTFPFKLKEWVFYQFIKGDYAVQLTIGHVSYMCSVSANVINLKSGKRYDIGIMKPFFVPKLDVNPQENSVNTFESKNIKMTFEVTPTKRILSFVGKNKKYRHAEIKLEVENDVANPKLIIATPFAKKRQFYLNYKENYYQARGYARFDDEKIDLNGATGLVDWGRGVWPYKHEWFWGNMSTQVDGKPFGLNIGWGFGDLSNATENIYFVDKVPYKVAKLNLQRDVKNYMASWRLWDDEGKMELNLEPFYNNYTQNKYVVVDTHCNQVYGKLSGWVMTNEGKLTFENKVAFIEHAVNRW